MHKIAGDDARADGRLQRRGVIPAAERRQRHVESSSRQNIDDATLSDDAARYLSVVFERKRAGRYGRHTAAPIHRPIECRLIREVAG